MPDRPQKARPRPSNDLKEELLPRPHRRALRQAAAALVATLGLAGAAQAYVLSAFDASIHTTDTAALNAALGLTTLTAVEDFEDATLIAGLTSTLAIDGRDLPNHAWDGITTTVSGYPVFTISLPGIRLFGIGISDNDGGGQTISINSLAPLDLSSVAGYRGDSSGRATYVIVRAEAGDADITRIAIDGSLTPMFDHLVLSTDSGLTGSIPEPGSALLALAGIGALARLRRR